MFKDAIANSPSKRVDIAVANAGVVMPDDVFDPEDGKGRHSRRRTH